MAGLTLQELQAMKTKSGGLTLEQLHTKQSPQTSLADSVWSGIASVGNAVAKGTVDTLGKNLSVIGNVLDPRTSLDQKIATGKHLQPATLKENVGAGLQLGSIITGGGTAAPTGVLANTALGAGLGAAATGGGALAENKSLPEAGKDALIGAAVGGAVSGATALVGRFLQGSGDKIQYSIIKPSKADLEDGFSIATIKKHDLGGSLSSVFTKTESKMDDLTQQLNAKLGQTDNHINLADVYANTAKRLEGGKLSSFGSNTSSGSALEQLQKEIANIGTDVSLPEAQVVKRAAGHFGAWQYGMFDPESTARQKVYNVFYNELKKAIEQNSPEGVREINKQMSELIPILNAVIRRIPIAERNNAISLTDVIGLVGSAINPQALGITLLNFLSKSGAAGNALSKLGPKVQSAAPALGTVSASLSGNTTQ